ncbi:MAG TPA: histidine phosphatase family protein [Vicinamibacterales bacterium]|nr:histidine phosphatase family protein [Vicinamibacterales bacterium]
MMTLFLVHHADAVSPAVDAQRPLSPEGRAHAEAIARRVAARGAAPEVVWHSGKLRARQTADAFWRACNPLADFAAVNGLQPDDPPERIRSVIEGDGRRLMLVSHMPLLPRLLSLLTSGSSTEFPPHGVVALELGESGWRELWREAG